MNTNSKVAGIGSQIPRQLQPGHFGADMASHQEEMAQAG
jgi:hypothetical protein